MGGGHGWRTLGSTTFLVESQNMFVICTPSLYKDTLALAPPIEPRFHSVSNGVTYPSCDF